MKRLRTVLLLVALTVFPPGCSLGPPAGASVLDHRNVVGQLPGHRLAVHREDVI